jgi:hypothetical protein
MCVFARVITRVITRVIALRSMLNKLVQNPAVCMCAGQMTRIPPAGKYFMRVIRPTVLITTMVMTLSSCFDSAYSIIVNWHTIGSHPDMHHWVPRDMVLDRMWYDVWARGVNVYADGMVVPFQFIPPVGGGAHAKGWQVREGFEPDTMVKERRKGEDMMAACMLMNALLMQPKDKRLIPVGPEGQYIGRLTNYVAGMLGPTHDQLKRWRFKGRPSPGVPIMPPPPTPEGESPPRIPIEVPRRRSRGPGRVSGLNPAVTTPISAPEVSGAEPTSVPPPASQPPPMCMPLPTCMPIPVCMPIPTCVPPPACVPMPTCIPMPVCMPLVCTPPDVEMEIEEEEEVHLPQPEMPEPSHDTEEPRQPTPTQAEVCLPLSEEQCMPMRVTTVTIPIGWPYRPVMLSMPEHITLPIMQPPSTTQIPSMHIPQGLTPHPTSVIVNIDQNMMEAILRNILGVQAGVTLSRPPLVSLPMLPAPETEEVPEGLPDPSTFPVDNRPWNQYHSNDVVKLGPNSEPMLHYTKEMCEIPLEELPNYALSEPVYVVASDGFAMVAEPILNEEDLNQPSELAWFHIGPEECTPDTRERQYEMEKDILDAAHELFQEDFIVGLNTYYIQRQRLDNIIPWDDVIGNNFLSFDAMHSSESHVLTYVVCDADAINNPPIPEPISPERDEEEEGGRRTYPPRANSYL